MAQKTLGRETTRTGSGKPQKAMPPAEGATAAEIVIKVPQPEQSVPPTPSARRDYPEVNAAIERGLADVAAGRVHTRRSYAEYADIEIAD